MRYKRLRRSFFARDTHVVARSLLGKLLIRSWRGQHLIGRIVEVESYVGIHDTASHASRGRTLRVETMFGPAGIAYVYLIYGMYHCLNIVTERRDFPAAVLIRAVEPVTGISLMQRARSTPHLQHLTSGPGKLTQAFQITRALNGEDLTTSKALYVAEDRAARPPMTIATSPRIGVSYAGEAAFFPWRYYVAESPFVSQRAVTPNG